MEQNRTADSSSVDTSLSPTFSLDELKSTYTVPENEFRWGNPVQIIVSSSSRRHEIGSNLYSYSSALLPLASFSSFVPLQRSLFLVFTGTTSVIVLNGSSLTIVGIAFAFGFVIATMVYALSSISHAHVNPVVTLGVLVMLNISMCKGLFYVGSQILGAIVGSAMVMGLIPQQLAEYSNYGATTLATNVTLGNGENWSVSIAQGFGIETVLTFYFVFTVFSTSKMSPNDPVSVGKLAPMAIGFAAFVCHVVGVPLTGASLNPARSLGPAIVSGIWNYHYIYWAGPVLGSILATLTYKFLFLAPHSDTPDNANSQL